MILYYASPFREMGSSCDGERNPRRPLGVELKEYTNLFAPVKNITARSQLLKMPFNTVRVAKSTMPVAGNPNAD